MEHGRGRLADGAHMKAERRRRPLVRILGIACLLLLPAAAVIAVGIVRGTSPPPFEDGFEEPLSAAAWQVDADDGCRIETTALAARSGSRALRIDAPKDERCELVPRLFGPYAQKVFREPFGKDRWYAFSVYIERLEDDAPPEDLGENTIVAQWHSSPDPFLGEGGRGPPLALRIHEGRWGLTFGWDSNPISTRQHIAGVWEFVGPVETGRWIDWTFHVRWSIGEDGVTEVWRDGELVLQRNGPNTYGDLRGVYLKLGLYHPTSDSTILIDEVSLGNADPRLRPGGSR